MAVPVKFFTQDTTGKSYTNLNNDNLDKKDYITRDISFEHIKGVVINNPNYGITTTYSDPKLDIALFKNS